MNDVNQLHHNDVLWHYQIIIFVKVVNDAAPCWVLPRWEGPWSTYLWVQIFSFSSYYPFLVKIVQGTYLHELYDLGLSAKSTAPNFIFNRAPNWSTKYYPQLFPVKIGGTKKSLIGSLNIGNVTNVAILCCILLVKGVKFPHLCNCPPTPTCELSSALLVSTKVFISLTLVAGNRYGTKVENAQIWLAIFRNVPVL